MSRTDLLSEFLSHFNRDNIIGYFINIDNVPNIYMYGSNRDDSDLERENYIIIFKIKNDDLDDLDVLDDNLLIKTGCLYHYMDRDGGYLDDLGYQIHEISSCCVKDISNVAQKILSISNEFLYSYEIDGYSEEWADQIDQHYQEYEKNKIWYRKDNIVVIYDSYDTKFILFPIYLKKALVEEYANL